MTVVTRMARKSRLSKMVDSPGGLSVGVALAQARKHLAALEPRSRKMIAGLLAEMDALQPPASVAELQAAMDEAYRLATSVIDAAGLFDRRDLCAAAASLCDLIDGTEDGGATFDWRVVPVHARAMSLMLASPPEATEQRQRILEGLADVRARKLPGAA